LVERPVDAEIDPALSVLLLRFREGMEVANDVRADVPLIVPCDAVELIRDEVEGDGVGSVVLAQELEERAAHSAVTRGIGRERRREVRSAGVAGRSAERSPVR